MNNCIFIKPIPPFLINYAFFASHISPSPFLTSASGFLHTYTKLIEHHIDFKLSQDLGLLPAIITRRAWNRFRINLQNNIAQSSQVNKRYFYGELRLSRLNSAYRLYRKSWRSGYFLVHTRYQSFFRANFEWLLLVFAYFSVALSALQVLLDADQGRGDTNRVLSLVSIVIGSTSIISVLVALVVMAALFVILRWVNENYARNKRFDEEGDFARK